MKRGWEFLITDHNVRETLAITDRAYILNDGAILSSGQSVTVANDQLVRRYYLGEDFLKVIHQLKRATWMRLSLLDRWLVKG